MKTLDQLKRLNGEISATGNYVGHGPHRVEDGVLHELAHLVTLEVPRREILSLFEGTYVSLVRFVEKEVVAYQRQGKDPDRDEYRAIAVCVQALRMLGVIGETGIRGYVNGSLALANDLMIDPSIAKGQAEVQKNLRTKVTKTRAKKLLALISDIHAVRVEKFG